MGRPKKQLDFPIEVDTAYICTLPSHSFVARIEHKETLSTLFLLVQNELETLLIAKQKQHKPRERFSYDRALAWCLAHDPTFKARYHRAGLTKGVHVADQMIKDMWHAAHPPRPNGRPVGLVTAAQLRTLALGRVLTKLALNYKPPKEPEQRAPARGNGRAAPHHAQY
jgi:hypothetical protein